MAARNGPPGFVKLLLDHGASPSSPNKDNRTPVHTAATGGYFETVKLLLERGANIEAAENDGERPLYGAAANDHTAVVRLLLDHGANPNVCMDDGRTPLYSAAGKYVTPGIKSLCLQSEIDMTFHLASSLYRVALTLSFTPRNYLETARLLIGKGADLDAIEKDGWTPLYTATVDGYLEMIDMLLSSGANMHVKLPDGSYPRSSCVTVLEIPKNAFFISFPNLYFLNNC